MFYVSSLEPVIINLNNSPLLLVYSEDYSFRPYDRLIKIEKDITA